MRRPLVLLAIISICMSFSACSRHGAHDARGLTALVSIEGSDTMTELVTAWANKFMKNNPDVPISINSGDTGGGLNALINRTTDLAAASRDLSASEVELTHTRGIRLKRVTVARDSIAIIVNPKNPLNELTLDQLKKLFTGSTTNWSQVGGDKLAVHVFTREEESGTSHFVKEHLLGDMPFAKTAKTELSGHDLLLSVAKDPAAIGFVGMGSPEENKVKILALKMSADSSPVLPTEESTVTDYPLSRPLILFMDEDAKPSVRKFVDYCLSSDAQKLVREAGYAPVSPPKQ
ncbi:MAG TPA: phosphate ABC transporter substrate-binding protein [Drouetiella sp.]